VKNLILRISLAPVVAFFLTLPVVGILQDVMGRMWIKDVLNNSGFSVWLALTGALIIIAIIHYFIFKLKE
jgi:hypothetical protein